VSAKTGQVAPWNADYINAAARLESNHTMQFTDKVVVVTGAASGIGQEICRLFGSRGARVGLLDREQSSVHRFAEELRQAGTRCVAATADVRQREELRMAVKVVVDTLGPVDILIPCAGICRASTVSDLKIPELEEILHTNFLGMVYLIDAVLPSMLERERGQIVGISSLAGVRGIPFEPAYSASKAAVAAYLESLRPELRRRGIAVTTVFPGYVQTPLLDEINGSMGADMSNGKALTAVAAAGMIVKAIERRRAYSHFPRSLGLSVSVSQLLPPRVYDHVMERMFNRFPISRLADPLADPLPQPTEP
jgi:short-subunit dehydrogenase